MKARFLALAALVLGLASCQTEPEGLNVNAGGEVDTTITVSLPETTRANSALGAFDNVVESDEYTIRYIFQVFYNGIESQAARQVIYTDYDQVSFPVRLVPNRHYNFVVWADVVMQNGKTLNELGVYDASADLHYNTEDLKSIKLNGDWDAMDETRDAFTGQFDTAEDGDKTVYNGAKSINITLTRPFAKLRIVTTDMEQLNDLGIEPKTATVEYTVAHYNAFNAFAGKVIGDSKNRNIKHENFEIEDYTDNVDDESKVLFTDYFFAADQDEVVNFNLSVYEENGTIIGKTINFNTPIPARRNYLTTIQGNILTDGNNVKVDVQDAFANAGTSTNAPYYQKTISSADEFLAALNEAGEFIVISDITIADAGTVVNNGQVSTFATRAGGATTTIDLNGKTITVENKGTDALASVAAGNTLVITNTVDGGKIELTEGSTGAFIENNGTVVIENGNIKSNSTNDAPVIDNNGTTNITGGVIGDNAVENNGKVNVNGGDVDDEAINNGEDAIVGSFIYDIDQLKAAVNAASDDAANEFTLAADIEGDVVVVIQKPDVKITIDGAGHTFNGYFKVHSNSYFYATAAATFKNINFETSTASVNFIEALENGSERYSTNITVENCTFTATGEAVNTSVGVQIKASKNAKVIGCTSTDMHSLIQAQSCDETVVVKDCTINGKNGVAFKQVKAATVEGTTIVAREYGIRFDGNTDNYGIVVNNNNVTAAQPFIVRKMTGKNNTIALGGQNILTSTREAYQIVITNGSDDAAYAAPTGTYTLTGADDFIVFPYTWVVTNGDELVTVLDYDKTKTVIFKNDIEMSANQSNAYGKTGINIKNGQTLDGAGHTFKVKNAWGTWDSAINTTGGTIKNINVTSGMRGIFVNHNSTNCSKVILENVTIDGTVYTISCDQGTNKGLEATNSTFNGWTSYAATLGDVKFTNCSFGEGQGYAYCRPYAPTEFVNCDFAVGYEIDAVAPVTFKNCTIGDVALTVENIDQLGNLTNKELYHNDKFVSVAKTAITDMDGVRYVGDTFESGYMENALWFNNYVFGGNAAIVVENKTYNAIVIENCSGEFKNDVLTIKNNNSSVIIMQNLDLTLEEGKKLIKSVNTYYQVFMSNITINGKKMTNESIAKYLENVGWYQVVEEI